MRRMFSRFQPARATNIVEFVGHTGASRSSRELSNKYFIAKLREVIRGLAEHKAELGVPLCPCRFYDDKEAAVRIASE